MFLFKIKLKLAREDLPLGDPSTFVPLKLTNRLILSELAVIFDPLRGWVAVFVKPKIEMQELWQLGFGWYEEVPPELKRKWMKLFEEMVALNNFKFKCCLTPPDAIEDPLLVLFCDASRLAFDTCAYARWKLPDGRFGARSIAAYSIVAPLNNWHYYMAESVFAMRLVNLRSVTCYTDQNFKENAHFGALNLFTSEKRFK